MYNIKTLLFVVSSIFILLFIFSCKKDDAPVQCVDHNYVLSQDGTECICPTETHFIINNRFDTVQAVLPTCVPKTQNYFYVIVSDEHCFNSGEFIAFDELGFSKIWGKNFGFHLEWGGHLENRAMLPSASKIDTLADGSLRLEYNIYAGASIQCYDWRDKTNCPHYIYGKTIGFSNSEQSEFNFTTEWTDECNGNILGTGTIRMWRDW